MSANDGARIFRHMTNVSQELSGEAQRKRLKATGDEVAKELAKAVASTPVKSGTLRDLSLSAHGRPSLKTGWHKVDIEAKAVVADSSFDVVPKNLRAYGPLRVLNDGRNAYRAGDKRVAGQRFSKKEGRLVDKRRTVKRSLGAYEGKGTWTRARRQMAVEAPKVYAAQVVKSIVRAVKG